MVEITVLGQLEREKTKLILKRESSGLKQTLGALICDDVEICKTLELAWKDNQNSISCIPKGTYKVVPRSSQKYKKHFHVLNVPSRSYILIHSGNYYTHTKGCILVGSNHVDINQDGLKDVISSKNTLEKLLNTFPNGFILEIV